MNLLSNTTHLQWSTLSLKKSPESKWFDFDLNLAGSQTAGEWASGEAWTKQSDANQLMQARLQCYAWTCAMLHIMPKRWSDYFKKEELLAAAGQRLD